MAVPVLRQSRKGVVLVLCMVFIAVFSSLGLLFLRMSVANAQMARNHHLSNVAMSGALSAMELGKYVVANTQTFKTPRNVINAVEASAIWANLSVALYDVGGLTVASSGLFSDAWGAGEEIVTEWVNYGAHGEEFAVRFYYYDSDPTTIHLSALGRDGAVTRQTGMQFKMAKAADVLECAIASRGRLWITQNSVIRGPVLSTWNRPEVGPGIETTSDTRIEGMYVTGIDGTVRYIPGTINTVIDLEDIKEQDYQMETLDENDCPVFDEDGNRVYSPGDKVQGAHEGINYGVTFNAEEMGGMRPEDYNTSEYKTMCTNIDTYDRIQREYFPHEAGNYNRASSSSSKRYDRKVYENRTFRNVKIPKGTHALFINCTFEDVLFVECDKAYSDNTRGTNNIRFEGCTFKGPIITDVPSTSTHYSWWMRNVLYFTGESTFDNQSIIQETAILAPNFNINLGNTGELEEGDGNILKGMIVGGIVDIRGNATIEGTIVSMYDTSPFTSGYVTNIGAADDGGDEGAGYIGGTITITPNPEQLMPSGITTAIEIRPLKNTYVETLCGQVM